MAKCIIHSCENNSQEIYGKFIQHPGDYHVHFICEDCWEYITTGKHTKSNLVCKPKNSRPRPQIPRLKIA